MRQQRKLPIAALCLLVTHGTMLALTFEKTFETERISGNRNDINMVQQEITDLASRVEPPEIGVIDVVVKYKNNLPGDFFPVLLLSISGEMLQQPRADKFLQIAERYVRLRLQGHTHQYALWLILHGNDPWPPELAALVGDNEFIKNEIAFPWIEPSVRDSLAFAGGSDSGVSHIYVIDGEIAWKYFIANPRIEPMPRQAQQQPVSFRFDAAEFNVDTADIIHRVYDEGLPKGSQSSRRSQPGKRWWSGFQKRLQQKTGIRWKTPIELNPSTIFD